MIRSAPYQTNHILTALNNYVLDKDDNEYLKYCFAYFEMNDNLRKEIINRLESFKDNQNLNEKFLISTNQILTLIETAKIYERTHEGVVGYENIKLDSISYLEESPELSGFDTRRVSFELICSENHFTINVEKTIESLTMPVIIYISPIIKYNQLI